VGRALQPGDSGSRGDGRDGGRAGPRVNGLVRGLQVDVLFPVAQSDEIAKFAARYPWLCSPRTSANDILVADWHTKRNTVAYLDVLNAIDKYWEQGFKHAAVGSDSACRLVTWDENDTLRHLFAIGFGAYDGALNLKDDFRDAFLKGLRASEVHISDGSDIPADLVRKTTPMRLTGADLLGLGGRFRTWTGGLYFGNAADVADLTAFWNIRAGGGVVEFFCLNSTARIEAFAKAHLAYLDSLPQRHPNIEDHIAFFFRNDHDAVLAALKTMPIRSRAALARFCRAVERAIERGKERPGPEPVLLPGAMTTDQTSCSRAAGKSKENCS
jgi:hypothetical protein